MLLPFLVGMWFGAVLTIVIIAACLLQLEANGKDSGDGNHS